jgi:hypothetical protein
MIEGQFYNQSEENPYFRYRMNWTNCRGCRSDVIDPLETFAVAAICVKFAVM